MNKPIHSEFACAGLAVGLLWSPKRSPIADLISPEWGNETSLAYQFSFAAILVVVPRWEQRVALHGLRELSLDRHGKTSKNPIEL